MHMTAVEALLVLTSILAATLATPLLDFTVHLGEESRSGHLILLAGDTPTVVSQVCLATVTFRIAQISQLCAVKRVHTLL
jgi:hypothetical protein